jgi:hypothetical protein
VDPGTMGAASVASTILGGALSGAGASASAGASADSFNFKAGIAKLNADINKQNAAWSLNQGAIKASNYGLKAGQEIAETKVVQAASGLDINSGSKEAVRDTQQDVAKFDQDTIRADAAHTAHGYEVKAAADSVEAEMNRTAGVNAGKAGKLNVLSSIIGTASSVASKWTQGNTLGMWSGGSGGPVGTFDNGGNSGGTPNWSY